MRELLLTFLCVCVGTVLLTSGCSKKEESPSQAPAPKIAKPIARPAPEKAGPAVPDEKKPLDQAEVKLTTVQDASKKSVEEPAPPKKAGGLEGVYKVGKGDTLLKIAGKEGGYGDPLMWVTLYRLNMNNLGVLGSGEDVPAKELPDGMALKTILKEEVAENLKTRGDRMWVVNAVSSMANSEVVPQAITLMKNGYLVYIVTAKVKGKDWMRVRVGFYKDKKEADEAGEKIKALLKLTDSWSTKVENPEFDRFAGY